MDKTKTLLLALGYDPLAITDVSKYTSVCLALRKGQPVLLAIRGTGDDWTVFPENEFLPPHLKTLVNSARLSISEMADKVLLARQQAGTNMVSARLNPK